MEDHGLIARDVALLKKAQGIGANRSFILYFVVCAVMTSAALLGVVAGGVTGFIVLGGIAAVAAIAKFTPWGENLIIGVVIIFGLITGALALYGAVGGIFS